MVNGRHTEEQFRTFFDAAPNGVVGLDSAGRMFLLNAQIEKMFGYDRGVLIGQPIKLLIRQRCHRGRINLYKRSGVTSQADPTGANRDLLGVRNDGREFPVEVAFSSMVIDTRDTVVTTVLHIARRGVNEYKELSDHARTAIELCQQLGIPAAVLQQGGRVLLANALLKDLSSQLVMEAERIKLWNAPANKALIEFIERRPGESTDPIIYSIPVPATNVYPPLVLRLLRITAPIITCELCILVATVALAAASSTRRPGWDEPDSGWPVRWARPALVANKRRARWSCRPDIRNRKAAGVGRRTPIMSRRCATRRDERFVAQWKPRRQW